MIFDVLIIYLNQKMMLEFQGEKCILVLADKKNPIIFASLGQIKKNFV